MCYKTALKDIYHEEISQKFEKNCQKLVCDIFTKWAVKKFWSKNELTHGSFLHH